MKKVIAIIVAGLILTGCAGRSVKVAVLPKQKLKAIEIDGRKLTEHFDLQDKPEKLIFLTIKF